MESVCPRCGNNRSPADTTHTSYCRPCWREYQRERWNGRLPDAQPRACARCAQVYTPRQRKASWFCSRNCKDMAARDAAKAERLASKPQRWCRFCGAELPQSMKSYARFCNQRCNAKAHHRGRRIKTGCQGAPLMSLIDLAERDRFRCGICRRRVDMTVRYPHSKSASVDHVVPVSEFEQGDRATHDPANLRLAHLGCNCSRRTSGVDQLALFG